MRDRILYVALGDSSGVGVGAEAGGGYVDRLFERLRLLGRDVELVNLCRSGATSELVRRHQLPAAIRHEPRLVTVAVGVNDLWRGVAAARFEENLDATCGALAATGATLVLPNLPDLSHAPVAELVPSHLFEGRFEAFNEAVDRVAARHRAVPVDLWGASQAVLPGRPEHFSPDGFHPSALGYQRLAEALWPAVSAALGPR